MRDTQRKKVYDAEKRAFGKPTSNLDLAEMQALVDKMGNSKELARRYTRAAMPVEVKDGRGRRRAVFAPAGGFFTATGFEVHGDEIRMPRWCRCKWMVLHEYAHHLTEGRGPSHGWQFAEAYLYLVRVFIAKSSEERLKAEFRAGKVKFKPPRTRRMTDGQREAARQRMLALHARKAEAQAAGSPR